MSRVADLLNPAPSGAAANASKPTVTSSNGSHRRDGSITSPLEALAIAATSSPTASTSATPSKPTATSPSFPPNPYLNTNPYAIKPQSSPSGVQTSSHAPASSQSPPAMAPALEGAPPVLSQSPVSRTVLSSAQQEPKEDSSTQPVVKTELSDDPTVGSAIGLSGEEVKAETTDTPREKQDLDVAMKESPPADPKPPKEPKKSLASTKKGIAKTKKEGGDGGSGPKKPAAKKRKLEPESKDGTPFSHRSGTPNSRSSKTPAQKRTPQQSPGPPMALNADEDEDDYDEASDDEGEVFCICRKPDDHTWMIACDGGCDDWFHGACVRMNQADGALIDKYICPNCESAGRGRTMWKPMCRLQGCREPARVAGKKPSKYCCDEHGRQFMQEKAFGKSGKVGKGGKADDARKKRKTNRTDRDGNEVGALNGEDSDDGHQAHLRGGVLKPGELKALATGVKSAEEFRRLGERIKTPETREANGDVKMGDGSAPTADADTEPAASSLNLTEQEQAALDAATRERSDLNAQLAMLADKDRLLAMIKSRHKSVAEELRKKDKAVKDICGFDSRLMWSDDEFNQWRTGEEGKAALEANVLPPPPKRKPEETNGASADDEEEVGRGVCKRKRCERHKTWAKLGQQEINLQRSQCWHQMRKIDRDEEELRDRALMRQRET